MNVITRPTVAALLVLIALTASSFAQQKRQAPAKPRPKPVATPAPPPTFDTLIPAESYTLYGEVRGVGQLIRSNTVNDALEPILKLAGPSREFRSFVKWLDRHADELMTSRLLVATWPTAKDLPDTVFAVEFASAEEAAKFAAPLNEFLPMLFPAPAPDPSQEPGKKKATVPAEPSLHIQQAGTLILLTPKPLKLEKLRPAGSRALADENNFRSARNRFNSEPVFAFIDIKAMEREEEKRRKQYQEIQRIEAEKRKQESAAAEAAKEETPSQPELSDEQRAAIEAQAQLAVPDATAPVVKEPPPPNPLSTAMSMLSSSVFRLQPVLPDAVAVALSFENDSFDVRALLMSPMGEESDAVPLFPALIPGPAYVAESPNILPADTELFVTMSLDLEKIHTKLSHVTANQIAAAIRGNPQTFDEVAVQSPFPAIEKLLKLSIKDDLLPLLGSEVAVGMPLTGVGVMGLAVAPAPPPPKQNSGDQPASAQFAPVVLVSLRDKEGMRALLPKLIEAFGFKGASQFAQTERREDTELVSYMNVFAYAFVGNFLVLSGDAATTRHVVDSYLKHETLSGDSNFRSYTRWQPRPSHGQLYVSPVLMESFKGLIQQPNTRVSEHMKLLFTRLATVAQPITYSLSNEGFGPLHELHVPKNLLLMAIAGISGEANPPEDVRNERMAMGLLYSIAYAQDQYKKGKQGGSYGTLEQLIAAGLVSKQMIEGSGYKIELTVSGDKFEVSAVPLEYGKTGSISYFIDQTRILRGGDRAGASATSSDPPIN